MRLALALFSLMLAAPAAATTYTLKADGTGDFATIQDAVDAAADGDEIVLEDGVYKGPRNRAVNYLGKAITIRSLSDDPTSCVIDGEFAGYEGYEFLSGETASASLEGVSIVGMTNGPPDLALGDPGAIRIENSSPMIRNVIVSNSDASGGFGVIVSVTSGSPEFRDCSIKSNASSGIGIGLSTVTMTGCVIEANSSVASVGGGLVAGASDVTLESCAIRGNSLQVWLQGPFEGGGIVVHGGTLSMTGCMVTDNYSRDFGSGIFAGGGAVLDLDRVTIAGNRSGTGGGIYGTSFSATVTSSILWGNCATVSGSEIWAGSGASLVFSCSTVDSAGIVGPGAVFFNPDVVHVNPLFCVPGSCSGGPAGIYSLQQVSPVHPLPGCGFLGAILQPCSVAIAPMSWGRVKAGYGSSR